MTELEIFGADLRSRIEEAEERLGHQLGWRLLASPLSVLDGAELAFIGLNPAGAVNRPDHPDLCMSRGSAFVDEIWDAPKPGASHLQRQIRMLFEALDHAPEKVLAGNLVPFRSPSRAELREPRASLDFGREIWTDILKRAKPSLIVTMGIEVFENVSTIVDAGPADRVPINWGERQARSARFPGGRIVGLPHFSRYAIIGRARSRGALTQLFPEGSFLE